MNMNMNFDEVLERECERMEDDLRYTINRLSKEDLMSLLKCKPKEAISLLNRIVNANEIALYRLIGKEIYINERFKRFMDKYNELKKTLSENFLLNIFGKIIKFIVVGVLKIVQVSIKLTLCLVMFIARMLYKGKKKFDDLKSKLDAVCKNENLNDINTDLNQVIMYMGTV